jgi:chaperonin GroES
MSLKPLHDWALIRPSTATERSAGGIIIPDTAKEKPQEGTIIAIGDGHYKDKDNGKGKEKDKEKVFVKTTLKSGDRVVYEKYSGRKVDINGEELVLVREDDILGQLN